MSCKFTAMLTPGVAIDLGTVNTVIYQQGKGIRLAEPSLLARSSSTGEIQAIGQAAGNLRGRTTPDIVISRPLRRGVLADSAEAEALLRYGLSQLGLLRIARPRMIVSVPTDSTAVERRAVRNMGYRLQARSVHLIAEPLAAALGVGIEVGATTGHMLVDIGGGSTDIAVIALNGIVASETIRVAGNACDGAIIDYMKQTYNLLLGAQQAESLKQAIGPAIADARDTLEVTGRHAISGLPITRSLPPAEVGQALQPVLTQMVDTVIQACERLPPELASDITDNGVILTGGGALIQGLEACFHRETGLPITRAETPLLSVAKGAGKVVEHFSQYRDLLF